MISTRLELWQNGAVLWQSDPEHKNTTSVWTTLLEARLMDLDFTLQGMGIWNATMSRTQQTREKYHWCAIVKIWCTLSHWARVASTQSESPKHNFALEVEKNNNKKSKISKRMARLENLCVR